MRPSVVIVEDHAAVLVGLRALLQARNELSVVGVARTGREALDVAAELKPDVVSVDLQLPGELDGFETCRRLRTLEPPPRIVVYTARESPGVIARVHEAGAIGIVGKSESPQELTRALLLASRGRPYTSPGFATAVAPAHLPPRQRQVLELIADGLDNGEIAQRLGVSTETVRSHVKALLQELEANRRSQAVAIGLRNALID